MNTVHDDYLHTINSSHSSKREVGKLAILCLTEHGVKLALRLSQSFAGACIVYIPERLQKQISMENEEIVFFSQWQETMGEVFRSHSDIVCIMAVGIVVRSIAELLECKLSDPAIVVMDEKGEFAVSLLSGHVGGANALAKQMAALTNGTAVITTSTDVHQKPAVDMLALELQATIEPREHIKIINRTLAEDGQVYITSPYPLKDEYTQGFLPIYETQMHTDQSQLAEACVYVSPYQIITRHEIYTHLIPQNMVVGIGCRKGIAYADLQAALCAVLDDFQIHRKSIKSFVTIDFKQQEQAICELSEHWQLPLLTVTKEQIAELDAEYVPSAWVQKTIGVGGVCEPAAKIASNQGITVVPKQIHKGVTISIAMEKSPWWDWDREIKNS